MDELQSKDLQIQSLQEGINTLLKSVKTSKRRQLDLAEIDTKLKDYHEVIDSARLELRHVHTGQRQEWEQLFRNHKNTLKELRSKYESVFVAANRDELFLDANGESDRPETAIELMQYGLDTQMSSTQSLQRTLQVIANTQEIGKDTVLKLEANTNQITAIYDQTEYIESSLTRSSNVLRLILVYIQCSDQWFEVCQNKLNANNKQQVSCDLRVPNSSRVRPEFIPNASCIRIAQCIHIAQ